MLLQKGDFCRTGTTCGYVKYVGLDSITDHEGKVHPIDTVVRISRSPTKMLKYLKTTEFWNHQLEAILDSTPYIPPEAWVQVWRKIAYVLIHSGVTDKVLVDKVSSIMSDRELIPDCDT